jgi:hypothetical protein
VRVVLNMTEGVLAEMAILVAINLGVGALGITIILE